jgi:26S proteasome regulatory subunit T1
VKESDTGLAHPSRWDLVSDKQAQQEEHPLQVRAPASPAPGAQPALAANAQPWPARSACAVASQALTLCFCWPQVARCTKIINPNTDDAKYVINIKQIAKFVVGLGDKVGGWRRGVGVADGWVPAGG